MRILICTFTYPPNRDGVAAASEAMAQGLAARGHQVTIATKPTGSRHGTPAIERGLPVFEFDADSHDAALRQRERERFTAWVPTVPCDIIVCHCWYMWPTDALDQMAFPSKPPVVLVSHGYTAHLVDWSPRPFWGLGAWLRELPKLWQLPQALRRYAWVTFLSSRPDLYRFLDLWMAKRIRFQRYSVIPNGAYAEKFTGNGQAFREAFGITDPLIFLCVANYSSRKNQKLAVRAFRQARLPGAVLVLIGSELGSYGREVLELDRELAASQPVGRVVCLERISQELTTAAYMACDVFVLSAKAETQPIVLIEAMAAGKPWISTDTGCVKEMPGGLVTSTESEFVSGLRRLATDPDLRIRLGKEGNEACHRKYAWEASVSAYDALLRRLVSSPREKPSSAP